MYPSSFCYNRLSHTFCSVTHANNRGPKQWFENLSEHHGKMKIAHNRPTASLNNATASVRKTPIAQQTVNRQAAERDSVLHT